MCELCRKLEKIREENPFISKQEQIDTLNAIWQNALSLKITMHHYKQELIEIDANEYYPDMTGLLEEFITAMQAVEQHALLTAKDLAGELYE